MTNFTALSLFSGAGGMDVGFKHGGFSIVAANELDNFACKTYRANHPDSDLFEGDINGLLDDLAAYKDVDVVFGGPPCQGFSVAGKMDPSDPRSQLVFSFVKVVSLLKPKAFVMENVKALASLEKFSSVRTELLKRFNSLGYNVSINVLNAKDFGAAQSRERVFFIGVLEDRHAVNMSHLCQYKTKALTLRQAIQHLGPAGSSTNPRICKAKITLASTPVLRKSPYAGMLFNGQGRPLNPDGWSSTLPASMGGNRTPIIDEEHLYNYAESWVEKYHASLLKGSPPQPDLEVPRRLRRLTIDEAAILQGFPPDYIFVGPQSKIYSQIGNAVPCTLAKAVASALKDALQGHPAGFLQGKNIPKGVTLELSF